MAEMSGNMAAVAGRIGLPPRRKSGRLAASRNRYFGALIAVGLANGAIVRIADAVRRDGWALAGLDTFGISAIAWLAAAAAVAFAFGAPSAPLRRADLAVGLAAAIAFLAPAPQLSWIGLTGVALYLWRTAGRRDRARRAALVLLALTVPMFWSHLLFAAFGGGILSIDAKMVGAIVGAGSAGNTIPFADGQGVLFLEPGCSSLSNVSLSLLCAMLFVQCQNGGWTPRMAAAACFACVVTIAVNVVRIALMGIYPSYYQLIHGPVGANLAGWGTMLAVAAICMAGSRSGASARI